MTKSHAMRTVPQIYTPPLRQTQLDIYRTARPTPRSAIQTQRQTNHHPRHAKQQNRRLFDTNQTAPAQFQPQMSTRLKQQPAL